jgi:hypothetical protein
MVKRTLLKSPRRDKMPTETALIRAAIKESPRLQSMLRDLADRGALGPLTDVSEDEELTVVAAPEHYGMTGAKQHLCGCGGIVWLSPSTQEMLIARGEAPTLILYILCFIGKIRRDREEARPQ